MRSWLMSFLPIRTFVVETYSANLLRPGSSRSDIRRGIAPAGYWSQSSSEIGLSNLELPVQQCRILWLPLARALHERFDCGRGGDGHQSTFPSSQTRCSRLPES